MMIMRFTRCTRGGIAAMTALIGTVLIGVSGLGVELGYWQAVKHSMQGAADAGVIEAAVSYLNGNTGGYVTSAKAVTAQNGWQDATGGVSVAVNTPPVNGIFTSASYRNSAFEVVISRSQRPFFAWAVGYSASTNIVAHAVALISGNGNGCVLALSTSSGALTLNGGGNTSPNLNASNCGVDSNSSTNPPITFNGSHTLMDAGSVTVGSSSVACPSANCNVSGSVTENTSTPDPYAGHDFTTPPSTLFTSLTSSGTTATAKTAIPNGFTVGSQVTVAGATGTGYNGNFVIPAGGIIDSTDFKYTMSAPAASPDPGTTITACETPPGGATFYAAAIYCGAGAGPSSYASDTVFSGTVSISNGTTWFGASSAGACPASASVVYFEGGLQLAGNNVNVHFCPGVYYMEGGSFQVTGNTVNVFGTGVTIILTTLPWGTASYATATIAGQGTITLSAPTSNVTVTVPGGGTAIEDVSGIVFFMDRNAPVSSTTSMTIGGNGNTVNLTGAVYSPTENVKIAGNGISGNNTTCTQVVAQTIDISGNGTFQSGCAGDGTSNIGGTTKVTMAE